MGNACAPDSSSRKRRPWVNGRHFHRSVRARPLAPRRLRTSWRCSRPLSVPAGPDAKRPSPAFASPARPAPPNCSTRTDPTQGPDTPRGSSGSHPPRIRRWPSSWAWKSPVMAEVGRWPHRFLPKWPPPNLRATEFSPFQNQSPPSRFQESPCTPHPGTQSPKVSMKAGSVYVPSLDSSWRVLNPRPALPHSSPPGGPPQNGRRIPGTRFSCQTFRESA